MRFICGDGYTQSKSKSEGRWSRNKDYNVVCGERKKNVKNVVLKIKDGGYPLRLQKEREIT